VRVMLDAGRTGWGCTAIGRERGGCTGRGWGYTLLIILYTMIIVYTI